MNTELTKIIADITFSRRDYHNSLDDKLGIQNHRNRLMNTMFNYTDDILECLEELEAARKKVAAYEVALEDADRELAARRAAAEETPAKPAKKKGGE